MDLMNIKDRSPSEHGGNRNKAKSRNIILWESFYQFLHWIEFNELRITEIFLLGKGDHRIPTTGVQWMQYPNIRVPNTGCSFSQHGATTAWLTPEWPCNAVPVPKTLILLGLQYLYRSLLWIIGQYIWNCEKTVEAACSVLPHLSIRLFTYALNVIKLNMPRPAEDNASTRSAVSRIWKAWSLNDS